MPVISSVPTEHRAPPALENTGGATNRQTVIQSALPAVPAIPSDAKRRANDTQLRKAIFVGVSGYTFALRKVYGHQLSSVKNEPDPDGFFKNFKSYPFSDEEKYQIGRDCRPYSVQYAQQFVFSDPEQKFKLATYLAADGGTKDPAKLCRDLGITTAEDMIKLGDRVAKRHPYSLPGFVRHVTSADAKKRFEWARTLLTCRPCDLNSAMASFKLTETDQHTLLFMAAKSQGYGTSIFHDMDFLSQDDKIKLLTTLAEHSPDSCLASISKFPTVGEAERIKIADKIGKIDPVKLFTNFDEFAIDDQHAVLNLYHTYFQPFTEHMLQRECEIRLIEPNGLLGGLDRLDHTVEESSLRHVADRVHDYSEKFLGGASNLPGFEKHAARLGMPLPCIGKFLDASRAESNPALREVLGGWALYAKLCFDQCNIPKSMAPAITLGLEAIFQHRQPETRYSLTRLLAEAVNPAANDRYFADRFGEISAALTKPHTRIFIPLLCTLTPDSSSAETTIKKYASLLSKDGLKDSVRQRNVVNGLLALAQTNHITDAEKQRLLDALTPATDGKDDVKAFAEAMQNLANLLHLASHEKIKEQALDALTGIQKNADAGAALGKLSMTILKREEGKEIDPATSEEFARKLTQATKNFRRPNGMITYASKLYAELNEGLGKDEIFKVLNRCVDTAILATVPQNRQALNSRAETNAVTSEYSSRAFVEERNNISKSAHLQRAYALQPDATKYFLNVEKTVKNAFGKYGGTDSKVDVTAYPHDRNQSKHDISAWSLKFAHDFEDYFLCGTDVKGSCQHIEEEAKYSAALMGYVMQGKNRIMTIHSADEKMQARCIVRLGIDEKSKKVVLHMEDSYRNPGVPYNCNEIFGQFARELSQQMGGVPIVTHSESEKFGKSTPYPHPISFLPDTAVCEYVDSEALGIVGSREGFSFTQVQALA